MTLDSRFCYRSHHNVSDDNNILEKNALQLLENGSVSDPERKIFISAGDDHLDWIDKLKDFIHNHKDWNDLDVENVLCCIHLQGLMSWFLLTMNLFLLP